MVSEISIAIILLSNQWVGFYVIVMLAWNGQLGYRLKETVKF